MTCKNCGAEIKDQMDYCTECGEPIEDSVITLKVIPDEAKPLFDFSGYVNELRNNVFTLMSLIGAVCLYLSPFMKWTEVNVDGNMTGGDLINMGSMNSPFYIGDKKILLCGIMLLIIALSMIVISAGKHIKYVSKHYDRLIIKILPIILAIVTFVLIILNKSYGVQRQLYNIAIYRCTGPILLFVGIVIYGVSIVMERNK